MGAPFHYRDRPEYRESTLQDAVDAGRLSPQEKELILLFLAERRAKKGLSQGRMSLMTDHLIRLRDFSPCPFPEMTAMDLMRAVSNTIDGKTLRGKPFSQHTKHDYVLTLKLFVRWMVERGILAIPISEVNEIEVPRQPKYTKTADDMLSDEEVLTVLVEGCADSQERAMVATVYDAALRIEELQDLRWKQIQRLKHGVAITTDKKTGYQRRIPCAVCGSYLVAWRNDYPGDATGDSYVFITKDGGPYLYSGFQYIIRKIRKRLQERGYHDIARRLGWHILRHSRLTEFVRRGMSETVLGHIGWGHRSSMIECYVHMSRDDIEREVFAIAGLQDLAAPPSPVFVPGICPECAYTEIPPTARYCPSCRAPLTEEARAEVDLLDRQASDQEILRVLQDPVQRELFLSIVNRLMKEDEARKSSP